MTTIKFKSDRNVQDHEGNVIFSAKAGEIVDIAPASAEHWVRRGIADYAEKPAPKTKASKKKAATKS